MNERPKTNEPPPPAPCAHQWEPYELPVYGKWWDLPENAKTTTVQKCSKCKMLDCFLQ